jgi:oxygen-independent coproporphyrinogen-3 oxidase
MSRLQDAGFEHYEISNFAKPGFRSRHNSSYWQGLPYYGFGPSAHSFDGIHTRSFNIADNRLYMNSLENGNIPSENEVLSTAQQINEFIMISLRTSEGLDLEKVKDKFGESEAVRILKDADKYIQTGSIRKKETILYLNQEGKLMADGIASGLFV